MDLLILVQNPGSESYYLNKKLVFIAKLNFGIQFI